MIELPGFQQALGKQQLFVIAGPCVLETAAMACRIAALLKESCHRLGLPYVFKSSYDKANRTALDSYRGPGIATGLEMLQAVRAQCGVPVLTDVHSPAEAQAAAEVVDMLQIPAFLARQTDLLLAAGRTGRPVNVKKAQFLSPFEMGRVVEKVHATGNRSVLVTERGTLFGYNNLVVDMRSFSIMAALGVPLVFDATHSVQLPGAQGACSGGERRYVEPLARAAIAAGADGIFLEVHEHPERALCDGPNALPLEQVPELLGRLLRIYRAVRAA
jgi:2-dehydro-3-deoxyphosphooctonate aldolase (KDO 8-P synthase)